MSKTILLTGRPGCGKTTLIRQVVLHLSGPVSGFYTREIREGGVRKGFEIVTLDGQQGVLAHVDIHSRKRIGKYGVDVSTLEALGVAAIQKAVAVNGIVVIDEIGPMEILSKRFRQAVLEALESNATVFGTIVKRSTPFTDRIKSRPGVRLIEVKPDSRDALVDWILALLK